MAIDSTEFGDFSISGSCATLDNVNAVPIYEFTPDKDGVYTIVATLLAWQPGGATVQFYVQATWRNVGGLFVVDGAPFVGGVGNLSPNDVTLDVSAGKGRILVTGVANEAILWRLKGQRFDLRAGEKYPTSSTPAAEFGDFAVTGSCATLDGTTAVPIYDFTPEKDGVYTTQAVLVAWEPGGRGAQIYIEVDWKRVGATVTVDGTLFSDAIGTLTPGGVSADVSTGKARVLVTGLASRQLLWRMKGVRLDLTA